MSSHRAKAAAWAAVALVSGGWLVGCSQSSQDKTGLTIETSPATVAATATSPAVVATTTVPTPAATTEPPPQPAKATIPVQQGADAIWWLAAPKLVTSDTTSSRIMVSRLSCSSGKTGEIMEPVVSVGQDAIIIRADVQPNPPGGYNCPGNDSVAVLVELPEPIGNRPLLDAACLTGRAVDTAFCMDGPERWEP